MRIRTHTNPFNYFHRMEKLDLSSIFLNYSDEIDIEIGFGRGVFLKNYASSHLNRNIIGVDIRKNIVDSFQATINQNNLSNIYLVHGNAEIFVEDCLPDNSISQLFLFHPDPWFKNKHRKRRVINEHFLNVLKLKLTNNGIINISTDIQEFWVSMSRLLSFNGFIKVSNEDFWKDNYLTHWTLLTSKKQGTIFYGSFQLSLF